MADIFGDLFTVNEKVGSYSQSSSDSWTTQICGLCGGPSRMLVVALAQSSGTKWIRCLTCYSGYVINIDAISPSVKPLSTPMGVTGVELDAWTEVRECLGVGSYTAAVMMCRKLLFHIAVANGLPATDDKDRAPTFSQAVEHLVAEGLVSARMRPWVEQIKKVGNDANHVIVPMHKDIAMDIATFTEQLLKLTYEMNTIMERQVPAEDIVQAKNSSS